MCDLLAVNRDMDCINEREQFKAATQKGISSSFITDRET
jgi:hypothetical protein